MNAAMHVVDAILVIATALLLVLAAFFCLQVVAGRKRPATLGLSEAARAVGRPALAVLIPAHDESVGLIPTLAALKPQLAPGDRLLVVADNCSDDTAAVALEWGAEVVERHDADLRGKGYALDFGYRYLLARDFDVLLIVDADCDVQPGAVETLAREAFASGRPTQALYLMLGHPEDGPRQRIAEFAWRVKNWARAAGMAALGLPCQLMGTGMAFPLASLGGVSFATGHLVEDMQMGLLLAANGFPPQFCDQALVTSHFPRDAEATEAQRARWEHGHLSTIVGSLPGFLRHWARRPSFQAFALFLDVAIPPLTLLVVLVALGLLVSAAWLAIGGGGLAFVLSTASLLALAVGLVVAWMRQGRDLVDPRALAAAFAYLLWKIPLLLRFVTGRQTEWVRSKRDAEHEPESK